MPFLILPESSQHVVKLFYVYCPIYSCVTCACLYLVLVWDLDACKRKNWQQYGRKAVFKIGLTTTRWWFDTIGHDMPLWQKWIIGLKLKTQFHICVQFMYASPGVCEAYYCNCGIPRKLQWWITTFLRWWNDFFSQVLRYQKYPIA